MWGAIFYICLYSRGQRLLIPGLLMFNDYLIESYLTISNTKILTWVKSHEIITKLRKGWDFVFTKVSWRNYLVKQDYYDSFLELLQVTASISINVKGRNAIAIHIFSCY